MASNKFSGTTDILREPLLLRRRPISDTLGALGGGEMFLADPLCCMTISPASCCFNWAHSLSSCSNWSRACFKSLRTRINHVPNIAASRVTYPSYCSRSTVTSFFSETTTSSSVCLSEVSCVSFFVNSSISVFNLSNVISTRLGERKNEFSPLTFAWR